MDSLHEETSKSELTDEERELFSKHMPEELPEIQSTGIKRRHFLKLLAITGGGFLTLQLVDAHNLLAQPLVDQVPVSPASLENAVKVSMRINGVRKSLDVDSRMTLLDSLRERLGLTGSKKGCDHGQCGTCTVLVNDRRVLSCLTLAATCEGKEVTTIEGLAKGDDLHPMQASFLKHDGFQCGYCTPGQICSAVALMNEAKAGEASYLTADVRTISKNLQLSDDEIRERMSGNICRCSAYPNILAAITEVHTGHDVSQNWRLQ
ncbi:2Fe-2S iron-sulfur cluster-binding protein [Spirosoma pollinicola]|uniref:Ferredoxin n=1 Tax=Spirosoma pollinicola TaxID=2057025 RepID=A0A2K8Z9P8_9BACT|nr:2Fe-2S iron-sulfur cluster-binding protein [Spirosoma pollinicola]AUD06608.1 ferredoxin [Spirosoma pollinicola]